MVCDARHYGEGHINDTFVIWREDHSKRFILQRINTDTFTDPEMCIRDRPYRPPLLDAGEPGEKPCTFRLGGPTCLAGDVVGDYSFAAPLTEGCLLYTSWSR